MITYEDECVGCPTELGCKEEADTLYEYEGEQVCIDCILESLDKVEIE